MMRAPLSRTIARHWPFANGAGRFVDTYCTHVDTGAGIRDCKTADGFAMRVRADDLIGRHLILSGQFDRSIVEVLLAFAEAGDRCVDIGANIGYVSALLLARIPGAHVLSIEPQPAVAAMLRHNLSQFDAARWDVIEAGLSDQRADGFMKVDGGNAGGGRLVSEADGSSATIALLPADDVLGGRDRIDLIKVDIEGHEATMFRAAASAIERHQPKAILFEDQTGQAAPDGAIGRVLSDAGYVVFAIDKQLLRTRLIPLKAGAHPTTNDYIAVSRRRTSPAGALRRFGIDPIQN